MRIKLYIITYNRNDLLDRTLANLYQTIDFNQVKVAIINNHSNFEVGSIYRDSVRVLHNMTRPDWSTGFLSRDYNNIIIDAVKDLDNPDCDVFITTHNDNFFERGWLEKLIEYHQKGLSFITQSDGCGLCSYTPETIRKGGMWIELPTIGFGEGIYFCKQIAYNPDGCSINDFPQKRVYNPVETQVVHKKDNYANEHHQASINDYPTNAQIFSRLFPGVPDVAWNKERIEMIKKGPNLDDWPIIPLYPYFEKKIPNPEKHYFKGVNFFGKPFLI